MAVTAAAYMRAAEALPFAPVTDIVPDGALILAPHPDDEALGCGGLIAALTEQGSNVRIAFISDGAGSHPNSRRFPAAALRELRRAEAEKASALLGVHDLSFLDWPDGAVPSFGNRFEEAVQQIAGLVDGLTTIVATSSLDPHIDHVATSLIAREAARRLQIQVRFYPVWSWRYLYPNILPIEDVEVAAAPRGVRLDISKHLDLKRHAAMAHRSQTTTLIDDDPDGFILTEAMLSVLMRPFEVYLEDTP